MDAYRVLQRSFPVLFFGLLSGCQGNPPIAVPVPPGGVRAHELTEGDEITVDVSRYFRDPDEDSLTFTATTSNATVAVVSVSGSTITIFAVAEGRATIIVTASDPDDLAAQQEFGVTVEAANRAPQSVGSISLEELTEGDTVEMDVSRYFRDPEGNPLTYVGTSSNASVASANLSGRTIAIAALGGGSAIVTVTARDPEGLTASHRVNVAVKAVTVDIELCRIDRSFSPVSGQPVSILDCELTTAYIETVETSPSVQSVTRITEFTSDQGQIGGTAISIDNEIYYWHIEDRVTENANLWRKPIAGVSRTTRHQVVFGLWTVDFHTWRSYSAVPDLVICYGRTYIEDYIQKRLEVEPESGDMIGYGSLAPRPDGNLRASACRTTGHVVLQYRTPGWVAFESWLTWSIVRTFKSGRLTPRLDSRTLLQRRLIAPDRIVP